MNFEERIQKFNDLIKNSKNIVFLGGAGVSTESGLPDFRGKNGLYNTHDVKFDKYSPEFLLSRDCLYKKSNVFYEYYRQKLDFRNYFPNITHKVLAIMENKGKMSSIITQNIDGLHQKAGSKTVYEIHGTISKNYCRKCRKIFDENFIFENKDPIPQCECGGMVRPDVVLYGEQLPYDELNSASNAIAEADLIIVGGTSLTTYPTANLIPTWGSHAKLVIINREKTFLDDKCEVRFFEDLGEVFSKIEY